MELKKWQDQVKPQNIKEQKKNIFHSHISQILLSEHVYNLESITFHTPLI